jgi:inositol transport system substrate-binding protein
MKRLLVTTAALLGMMAAPAFAKTTVAVSMAHFDDNFLTILRNAMATEAKTQDIDIQFEDAQGDIGKQLNQIQNFIAQKADAIIVNPVDTSATPKMTKLATEGHIPLVYVNRKPIEEQLPPGVSFVGSDENLSGTLEAEELARLMNHKGNIAIMVGELATNAAELRTKDVEKVVAKYPDMKIIQKQTANFQRNEAIDLMNNWIVSGEKIDAVAANNDEMALGALIAMKQAGISPEKVLVGGIDATPDALAEMDKGNLAVTVFQDARGQGKGAVDTALKLVKGEQVESIVWVPFQIVTRDNYKTFLNK